MPDILPFPKLISPQPENDAQPDAEATPSGAARHRPAPGGVAESTATVNPEPSPPYTIGPRQPFLADRAEAARLLMVSTRTIDRMRIDGAMPAPIMLTRSPRWSTAELDAWIRAGAPTRDIWDRIKRRK